MLGRKNIFKSYFIFQILICWHFCLRLSFSLTMMKGWLIFLCIIGLVFHPLDGILHALLHTFALFIVPIHFTSHLLIIFIEAIWTTNIHDCIHGNVWPIMGVGYHTIHHTTYRHNYATTPYGWIGFLGLFVTPTRNILIR